MNVTCGVTSVKNVLWSTTQKGFGSKMKLAISFVFQHEFSIHLGFWILSSPAQHALCICIVQPAMISFTSFNEVVTPSMKLLTDCWIPWILKSNQDLLLLLFLLHFSNSHSMQFAFSIVKCASHSLFVIDNHDAHFLSSSLCNFANQIWNQILPQKLIFF